MTHAPSRRPRITPAMRAIADPRGAALASAWSDALHGYRRVTRR
jgi:hypothetical protein